MFWACGFREVSGLTKIITQTTIEEGICGKPYSSKAGRLKNR